MWSLHFWKASSRFPQGRSWKASKPLMLVHYDVFEPMQTLFLSGSKYFMIFVDDFSKTTWSFFFLRRNPKSLNVSSNSRLRMRNRVVAKFWHLTLTAVVNFLPQNLTIFTTTMTSKGNLQQTILSNKIESLNIKVERWLKQPRVCYKVKLFQRNFGLKLLELLSIFSIDFQLKVVKTMTPCEA